ncbi:MAG: chemotaxis protein CheW [Cyanobacteria bacterium P01_H01_bin.130]
MSSLTPAITLPGSPQGQRSTPATPADHFRVIAFGIGTYTFALPMGAIARVIHCPPLENPGLGRTGLIHLEQQVIRILDLHDLAADQGPVPEAAEEAAEEAAATQAPRFLVIARRRDGELCGIPVDTPPDLLEVERSQVRPLPPSTHQDPILSLAPMIAVLPGSEEQDNPTATPDSTLLLLDLNRIAL